MFRSVAYEEGLMGITKDVDSFIFCSTSLTAFLVMPKINIKTAGKVRPTENLKLAAVLRQVNIIIFPIYCY